MPETPVASAFCVKTFSGSRCALMRLPIHSHSRQTVHALNLLECYDVHGDWPSSPLTARQHGALHQIQEPRQSRHYVVAPSPEAALRKLLRHGPCCGSSIGCLAPTRRRRSPSRESHPVRMLRRVRVVPKKQKCNVFPIGRRG